jgi:SagB-type dehydrogenase family enzyme
VLTLKVRRSSHLVAYWRHGSLFARNYATRQVVQVTPFICQLLDSCGDWTTLEEVAARLGVSSPADLRRLLSHLAATDLLEVAGRSQAPNVRAMARLDAWNPVAGFFHTSTKDVRILPARRSVRDDAGRRSMPPVVKRYPPATPSIELPKPRDESEFSRVLRERRTWRRFSSKPIGRNDLATLLGLTSGVQQWVTSAGQKLALKTSPSGGARHSIETYVVVRDVAQVKPGVYHYAPDRHALEKIRGPVSLKRLRDYLPNSGYFAMASAMVFFTTIFERILWRYPYSRAYRAALVEAGHLCQTFCLTATWLGLAPYCVMGLADSLIERDLGIDGIRESVLYCAGVGRPPAGSSWAPLPRGTLQVRPNRSLSK